MLFKEKTNSILIKIFSAHTRKKKVFKLQNVSATALSWFPSDTAHFKFVNIYTYVMLCAIWYNLYNLKNAKCTHGGVLLLVKLQGCYF